MFNLQGSELVIILLLALVVLGPEKLPEAMRRAGRMYADLKKMSSGFQEEFRSAIDEPLREMRETGEMIRDSADFRRLRDGERAEKPRSAEMAAVDGDDVPSAEIPFSERAEPTADPPIASAVEGTEPEHDPFPRSSPPPAPPPPFSASIAPEPGPADRERSGHAALPDHREPGGDDAEPTG